MGVQSVDIPSTTVVEPLTLAPWVMLVALSQFVDTLPMDRVSIVAPCVSVMAAELEELTTRPQLVPLILLPLPIARSVPDVPLRQTQVLLEVLPPLMAVADTVTVARLLLNAPRK